MTDIRVPDIGDVDEVEIIEICVSVGDQVLANESIVVIESDKASMEVPAGQDGKITSIEVKLGDRVAEGSLLATIEAATSATGAEEKVAADATAVVPPAVPPPAEPVAPREAGKPAPAPIPASIPSAAEVDVLLPDIGDAKDVIVIEIAVKPGDVVAAGDLLLVVESDKASMEVPSPSAGTIAALLVALDQAVNAGDRLLSLKPLALKPADSPAPQPASSAPSVQQAAPASKPAERSASPPVPSQAVAAEQPPVSSGADVYAGPAVRLMARELGVDLTQVKGSGSRGRIVKEDVQAFVKTRLKAPVQKAASGSGIPALPVVDFSRFGPVEIEPMSRIRRAGAQNLHRSWLNVPHVTQNDDADITALEEFRKSLKAEAERRGVKVTPLSFIVRACCAVLKQHARFNASLDASVENYVLKRYYHIGFAVDAPDGLVVPVIRDADRLGIWELSSVINDLADKARRGKLGMNDMSGGTFSISSLGALGGTGFTPIVNAPEVAILGVCRLVTKPQWNGREFLPREMLPLSLSYDHRAINGAEAGRFMADLCAVLGDLRRLIL